VPRGVWNAHVFFAIGKRCDGILRSAKRAEANAWLQFKSNGRFERALRECALKHACVGVGRQLEHRRRSDGNGDEVARDSFFHRLLDFNGEIAQPLRRDFKRTRRAEFAFRKRETHRELLTRRVERTVVDALFRKV